MTFLNMQLVKIMLSQLLRIRKNNKKYVILDTQFNKKYVITIIFMTS